MLLESVEEGKYYIKLTLEGIVSSPEYSYPLKEGDEEEVSGIKLWYKVTTEDSSNSFYKYVEEPSFNIDYDKNGNIISLSGITKNSSAISSRYSVTFAYLPQLHYQNIYNTYSKQLATDEAKEKEAAQKIEEIKTKI